MAASKKYHANPNITLTVRSWCMSLLIRDLERKPVLDSVTSAERAPWRDSRSAGRAFTPAGVATTPAFIPGPVTSVR